MRKLILIVVLFLGFGFLLTSCTDDAADSCKYCYTVTTDADGNKIDEGTPEEYCGSDLDDVDGTSDTDADGNTVEYKCDASIKK